MVKCCRRWGLCGHFATCRELDRHGHLDSPLISAYILVEIYVWYKWGHAISDSKLFWQTMVAYFCMGHLLLRGSSG